MEDVIPPPKHMQAVMDAEMVKMWLKNAPSHVARSQEMVAAKKGVSFSHQSVAAQLLLDQLTPL